MWLPTHALALGLTLGDSDGLLLGLTDGSGVSLQKIVAGAAPHNHCTGLGFWHWNDVHGHQCHTLKHSPHKLWSEPVGR